MSARYSLRPSTDADRDLLLSIYASVREPERKLITCTDKQWNDFVQQQFETQDTEYRRNNPDAEFSVIMVDGRAAGRLYMRSDSDRLHLIDIALREEFRNQGLGGTIMADLQSRAAASKVGLTIYVEENNPAMRLYERLGFAESDSLGLYRLMRWDSRSSGEN